MTTIVREPTTSSFPRNGRVTQLHVVLSEWTKLRSLRSTRWSLLVAVVAASLSGSAWVGVGCIAVGIVCTALLRLVAHAGKSRDVGGET